jgi:rhodanese-related sulfurtransferase
MQIFVKKKDMTGLIKLFKIQGLLAVLALFYACDSNSQQKGSFKNIQAAEVQKVFTEQKAVLMDIRTPGEVNNGYIDGTEKFINFNDAKFEAELDKLDKNKTYIVYCASGGRSARASNLMVEKGFKNVYNLQGGIGAWTGKVKRP